MRLYDVGFLTMVLLAAASPVVSVLAAPAIIRDDPHDATFTLTAEQVAQCTREGGCQLITSKMLETLRNRPCAREGI